MTLKEFFTGAAVEKSDGASHAAALRSALDYFENNYRELSRECANWPFMGTVEYVVRTLEAEDGAQED